MDQELGREVNVYTATFESTVNNVTVRKHYELSDGRYSITVRSELINNGETAIRPSIYYQLTRDGNKPEARVPSTTPIRDRRFTPTKTSSRKFRLTISVTSQVM